GQGLLGCLLLGCRSLCRGLLGSQSLGRRGCSHRRTKLVGRSGADFQRGEDQALHGCIVIRSLTALSFVRARLFNCPSELLRCAGSSLEWSEKYTGLCHGSKVTCMGIRCQRLASSHQDQGFWLSHSVTNQV